MAVERKLAANLFIYFEPIDRDFSQLFKELFTYAFQWYQIKAFFV